MTLKSISTLGRRKFLKTAAASGALAAGIGAPAVHAQARTIKIGYVSPQTGPLAAFAEVDGYTVDGFLETVGGGVQSGSKNFNFEVVIKDSQSNPSRAAEVAKELIVDDEIDIMIVAHTPETTNPVSTICEIEEIPCISTLAPWQPWFIGRQGNPGDPGSWTSFDYTYHFFWGLEDLIAVFTNMWNQLETNKSVGGLFPNDADGNAWGDPNTGMPPALDAQGFSLTDPGRYQNLQDDFSAQINAFKENEVEIVTGVVLPPDFATFWTQARQQGFVPKAASIGKAILFPSAVNAIGDSAQNLSSEVWWSNHHPFSSSLTGDTAANWLMGDVAAALNRDGRPPSMIPVPAGQLAKLIERTLDETVSSKIAKSLFEMLWSSGEGDVDDLIAEHGLKQVSDDDALTKVVADIVAANPAQAAQYRAGQEKLLGFFVGQVMKATSGKANPRKVNTLLREHLASP